MARALILGEHELINVIVDNNFLYVVPQNIILIPPTKEINFFIPKPQYITQRNC